MDAIQEFKLNLDHPKVNGETTVSNAVTEVAAIMGENVKFRRGFLLSKSSTGVLSAYLHTSPQPGTNCSIWFPLSLISFFMIYSCAFLTFVLYENRVGSYSWDCISRSRW